MHKYIKKIPKASKKIKKRTILSAILVFLMIFGIYFFVLRDLPSPEKLNPKFAPQSTQIFDRNDVLLYTIYSNQNRTFVPLSVIPKNVQMATIAIEDKDFYHHGAIDLRGILRSFYSILIHKQIQGGS